MMKKLQLRCGRDLVLAMPPLLFLAFSVDSVWAQEAAGQGRSDSSTVFAWLPLLLLVGAWIWFFRRSGIGRGKTLQDRSLAHMDRLEKQNEQILEMLGRIETSLKERR